MTGFPMRNNGGQMEVTQHFKSNVRKELSTQPSLSRKNIFQEWGNNNNSLRWNTIKRISQNQAFSKRNVKESTAGRKEITTGKLGNLGHKGIASEMANN